MASVTVSSMVKTLLDSYTAELGSLLIEPYYLKDSTLWNQLTTWTCLDTTYFDTLELDPFLVSYSIKYNEHLILMYIVT